MVALQDRPSFSMLLEGIKETFATIDKFEWQQYDELRQMRDEHIYKEGGYTSFQELCESELSQYGGYRRVNQLIQAKEVSNTLKGTELEGTVTNERQARPMAKLLKFPDSSDKIRQVVALAKRNSDNPTSDDFAKAVLQVLPKKAKPSISQNEPEVKEPRFFLGVKVRFSSQNHPLYGQEGEICGEPPNLQQQFVQFAETRETIFSRDLTAVDAPVERKFPLEYEEAIAQLKQQHKEEVSRLEKDLRAGLLSEAEVKAAQRVKEQLEVANAIASFKQREVIELQQKIEKLESLQLLEVENQKLQQENEELRNQLQQKPMERWNMSEAVVGRLNKNVQSAINNTIDLRSLAVNPPTENQSSVVKLLGLSLEATAQSMPKFAAELRKAAAIILQVDEESLEKRAFQLRHLPEAITSIKSVLALPNVNWMKFTQVSDNYPFIKQEIWMELNPQEREKINQMKFSTLDTSLPHSPLPNSQPLTPNFFTIGSRVLIADVFSTRAKIPGTVIGIENEMLLVHWSDVESPLFQHRYEAAELRIADLNPLAPEV